MNGIEGAGASLPAVQQASLRSEISFTVARKQLDAQQQQGQAVLELLENAAQLVTEAGKGSQINTLA